LLGKRGKLRVGPKEEIAPSTRPPRRDRGAREEAPKRGTFKKQNKKKPCGKKKGGRPFGRLVNNGPPVGWIGALNGEKRPSPSPKGDLKV